MSVNSTSMSTNLQTAASLLQQLNTVSNPSGTGLPVSQYVQDLQTILQQELEKPIQNQISSLSSQQSALTSLQSALQAFQQATETLASLQSWSTVQASSSDSSVLSVTASAGASIGTYQISVTQLASAQTTFQNSALQTSATGASTLASGTLVITPKTLNQGQSVSINIVQNESLQSIANAINQYTSQTGVAAAVLSTGQSYFLALSSVQTGAAYGFTVTETNVGSSGDALTFQTDTQAQDAQISVGGQTLSSPTNTFANYIPGLTLQVNSTGTATVTVSQDTSGALKAVQTWMSAYNTLIDTIRQDTAYTPGAGTSSGQAGPLFGDPLAQELLQEIPAAVSSVVSNATSPYNSLASIGIVLDPSTGHLEFQSASGFSSASGTLPDGQSIFQNALTSSLSNVEQLFGVVNTTASQAVPTSGVLGNLYNFLSTMLVGNPNGTGQSPIQAEINALGDEKTSLQNYLNLVDQQIQYRVQQYTDQLNRLNAVMQQAQAQMQQLSAMFKTSSSNG
ncbi:flagellar filament capping protein FliD [Alicyclobacillus sendaiensis]|uniref:flagellar filament capping protein FliD n=1 Tax=Alicyclobacillus sendaiensis TaxID=192387 RepID=UPI00078226EC|nr:flagellar filament capping protein FliD [Alicyclobacillus sendaiensis]